MNEDYSDAVVFHLPCIILLINVVYMHFQNVNKYTGMISVHQNASRGAPRARPNH